MGSKGRLAADHGFLPKRTVKAAARAADARAAFMAKPFADQAANGLHIHVSLLDRDGHCVFVADETNLHRAIDRMAVATVLPAYLGTEFWRLYRICCATERNHYHDVIPALDYIWYQHNV